MRWYTICVLFIHLWNDIKITVWIFAKVCEKRPPLVKLRSLSFPDYRLSFSNKLLSGRYIDKKSLASESIRWWWRRRSLQSYAYASFIDYFIAMSVYPSNWLHNTHALNCDDYDYYLRLHVQCALYTYIVQCTQICVRMYVR